jgi:hypothetical protein
MRLMTHWVDYGRKNPFACRARLRAWLMLDGQRSSLSLVALRCPGLADGDRKTASDTREVRLARPGMGREWLWRCRHGVAEGLNDLRGVPVGRTTR